MNGQDRWWVRGETCSQERGCRNLFGPHAWLRHRAWSCSSPLSSSSAVRYPPRAPPPLPWVSCICSSVCKGGFSGRVVGCCLGTARGQWASLKQEHGHLLCAAPSTSTLPMAQQWFSGPSPQPSSRPKSSPAPLESPVTPDKPLLNYSKENLTIMSLM